MAEPQVSGLAVAQAAAGAATRVDGVVELDAGMLGEVATYSRHGRVPGVRFRPGPPPAVQVHLVARFGRPLDALAEEVQATVAKDIAAGVDGAGGIRVDVHVADVVEEGQASLGDSRAGRLPG